MYTLIRFLKKYNYIILFLILEVICIIMMIYNLPYQKRKITNFGNNIAGNVFKTKSNWTNYFHLKDENTLLTEHNAILMSMALQQNNDTASVLNDNTDELRFIPANVINNSINRRNNYLLIDKGKKDGIKRDMGVICENGIVGKVVNVSNNYASVISMLHPYSIISARFTNNQHLANVSWNTNDYQYGTVKDIPLHLHPKKGDTIVTSGFSNIFPPDFMIGTIEEMVESESKDFNTAKIKFSTNFSTLRHVYVIENINQNEIDSLLLLNN